MSKSEFLRAQLNPIPNIRAQEVQDRINLYKAAPDLLAACKAGLDALQPYQPEHYRKFAVQALTAAIAKAEGEQ